MEYLPFVASDMFVENSEEQADAETPTLLYFAPDQEVFLEEYDELGEQDDDRHGYSYPSLFF